MATKQVPRDLFLLVIWFHTQEEEKDAYEHEFPNKVVLDVSPVFAIIYFCNHCNIRFDPILVKVGVNHEIFHVYHF